MQKTINSAMHKNMGSADRIIRLVTAVVLGALVISQTISGLAAIITSIIAAVLLVTSFAGFCPAYLPFGVSTLEKNKPQQHLQKKNEPH